MALFKHIPALLISVSLLPLLLAGCGEISLLTAIDPDRLSLSPSSATLSPGESADFTASEGVPPYGFSVDSDANNTFETVSEDTARFTLDTAEGLGSSNLTWEVTVTDARGDTSSSTVHTETQ